MLTPQEEFAVAWHFTEWPQGKYASLDDLIEPYLADPESPDFLVWCAFEHQQPDWVAECIEVMAGSLTSQFVTKEQAS